MDWHNLGHSILSLSLSPSSSHDVSSNPTSWIVTFAKWYEEYFGSMASGHLCVTRAFKVYLTTHAKISEDLIRVLYDRPPTHFERLSISSASKFLMDKGFRSPSLSSSLTTLDLNGLPIMNPHRSALLVSSTSWTEDEDFSILQFLVSQSGIKKVMNLAESHDWPDLTVVITGKGPLKEYWESKIESLALERVLIQTAWLSLEEYPKLLGNFLPFYLSLFFYFFFSLCVSPFNSLCHLQPFNMSLRHFSPND